jgi:hypothetical protein
MGKIEYALDIQELREFQGGHMGWWTKGHWGKDEFAAALVSGEHVSRHNADYFTEDGPITDYIRHEHWRCVPVGPGERGTLTVRAKAGKPGAFPVTVVEDV